MKDYSAIQTKKLRKWASRYGQMVTEYTLLCKLCETDTEKGYLVGLEERIISFQGKIAKELTSILTRG